ncbi:lysine 2,3-aminomutase [Tenacibaculum discolor]|uniref:Lysine 2,3-aminomutase n=1 Tax=Tenacibaculum discolor TaxID=361581 RepID=A0A2G1BYB9_9FLAO|nr:lysine 2,3-aminomutase [Tenacibaculum discolor]MDP2542675.1 lysine 2,3-aminomutase [Tenacibaculum discolor]PHN99030.1 lysine 2,3-aminomutase [Tenacibaculum discolor]
MSNNIHKYQAWSLPNFLKIPQVKTYLSEGEIKAIRTVGSVLPFKVNNYVVEELIDWNNIPNDPIFQLTFPQKEMLSEEHYKLVSEAIDSNMNKREMIELINGVRKELNPHSSSQVENIPLLDGVPLTGIQHKYKETVLFFPSNSQTCHAYCTFCFRWPQFVNLDAVKFAMKETNLLIKYIENNKEITDLLFTGGDPMIMKASIFKRYLEPILKNKVGNLQNIRIGTKALGYWPYKFLTDDDADEIIALFEEIIASGYNLTIMAHFNHPNELKTTAVKNAIKRILSTGAQIRTQSPIMKYINDSSEAWEEMWREQVKLGCVPYYMFLARDTGAQSYFAVTLNEALEIYQNAYRKVGGLARTVKGPVMSANQGKIQVLGVNEINNEKLFSLRFNQARNSDWVGAPFFSKYNEKAVWLNDLIPAFGAENFFFEKEHLFQNI